MPKSSSIYTDSEERVLSLLRRKPNSHTHDGVIHYLASSTSDRSVIEDAIKRLTEDGVIVADGDRCYQLYIKV